MDKSINDGLDYSGDAAAGSFFSSDYKRLLSIILRYILCSSFIKSLITSVICDGVWAFDEIQSLQEAELPSRLSRE